MFLSRVVNTRHRHCARWTEADLNTFLHCTLLGPSNCEEHPEEKSVGALVLEEGAEVEKEEGIAMHSI